MLDRLQALADRYDKLSELLCDPDVASDSKKLREYSKEQSDLQETYEAIQSIRALWNNMRRRGRCRTRSSTTR